MKIQKRAKIILPSKEKEGIFTEFITSVLSESSRLNGWFHVVVVLFSFVVLFHTNPLLFNILVK